MPTPKSRARWVRGTLVGVSSAATTVAAHAAAGGGIPHGPALVISLLVCVTIGALLAGPSLDGRVAGWSATAAALCAAQVLGHVILSTMGHHHSSGLGLGMVIAHAGAAAILGAAIAATEYLYVVCSSVLSWLRVFATRAPRPASRPVRRVAKIVVVAPVLADCRGMRAPPEAFATV